MAHMFEINKTIKISYPGCIIFGFNFGFECRLDLLFEELVPINGFEEGLRFNLRGIFAAQTLSRVSGQQLDMHTDEEGRGASM